MPALNRVSTCVASFSSSIAASKRILNIIRPEFSTKIHNTDTSSEELLLQIADFKLDIKWDKDKAEHDHFPRVNPFLWDFSLEIKKGDVVAISGASGVGKSTLLKSTIGQYISPNQVKINGDEVSIFSRAWLDNFAYVPQESKYFSGTVLENILLGRGYDKELIAQVVSSSMLFDVGDISRGLNLETNLGVNGSILSGGQLQRLSIARALYGKPKVLLLDEFTSGLDEATEKTIINTIENISMNISVIAVSHRPVFNVISNKTILFVEGLPTWA